MATLTRAQSQREAASMSAQLRLTGNAPDRRAALLPDTRLCLAMVSAGLSALATISPAARRAIVDSLDESLMTGMIQDGESAEVVARLRDQIAPESEAEAQMLLRLQEAI